MNTPNEKIARLAASASQGPKDFIKKAVAIDNFSKRQSAINKRMEALIAASTILSSTNVETRDIFAERRVRHGKTRKDAANGNKKRNHEFKMARGTWCGDSKARAESFPSHTCNGKRSRALRGEM